MTLICFLLLSAVMAQPGNELIDYHTIIKFEKGKLIEESTFLIQINNKEADWISDVEIHYSGETLDILEASIQDTNGNTHRTLKKKEISTRNAFSSIAFFQDSYVKEFKLKWNQYPYRIKYRYRRVAEEFLYVAKWYPVLHTQTPTRQASLTVQLPLDFAVNTDYSNAFTYYADSTDHSKTMRWEIKALSPVTEEAFSPALHERVPAVTLVPKVFTYGLRGSFASWADYGSWQFIMNEGLDKLPLTEQMVINQLIAGVTDKREIVKILYHHLQDHTRYINVSIDIGGLKPYPAAYVCANKYGDCKALTMYMKALLKHAGIEAYYTKVYADENPVRVNPELPSQQFNHVILCVPLDGDTLWLENTSNYLPYNYLGTFTQNRPALLVGKESRLIKTPALRLEDVLEKTTASYVLNQEGEGTLAITQDLQGETFEFFKGLQHHQSEPEQQKAIEKRLWPKHYELINWKITQADRDLAQIHLQIALEVSNQLRKLGNMLVLSPNALALPRLEHPKNRSEIVRINYPVNQADSANYQLSFLQEYSSKLPKNVSIETKYGRYQEHYYAAANNQLSIARSFQLYAGEYPKEDYEAFYAFIESIREVQKKSAIIFNPL